ncbi:MAG: GGDEF domain-containing protein [Candidatus Acidiferrales bacterium]
MNESDYAVPEIEAGISVEELQKKLHQLERRDWWLWWAAVMVMLLLTATVVALSIPQLIHETDRFFQFNLDMAVRALVALVLIFNLYTVYQQVLIKRMRTEMAQNLALMTQLRMRAEEFHKQAIVDPLTGLFNRRLGEQRLRGEVSRSQRYGHPLSVLAFDLNGFKQINDRYGHAAGDEVLRRFAESLNQVIRSSDVAVRLGGDEFLLILPECQPEQVQVLVGRLGKLEVELQGEKIRIRFSAGWAGYEHNESSEQLLERADQALYVQKRALGTARLEAALT